MNGTEVPLVRTPRCWVVREGERIGPLMEVLKLCDRLDVTKARVKRHRVQDCLQSFLAPFDDECAQSWLSLDDTNAIGMGDLLGPRCVAHAHHGTI